MDPNVVDIRWRRLIDWTHEFVLSPSFERSRWSRHSAPQKLKGTIHGPGDHVPDLILDIETIAMLPEDLARLLTDQRGLRQKLPVRP